jgi:superfamily I DNA and/or RNA helicase
LGSAGQGEVAFGTVIVDEAARANPLDLFIPMTMARERIILVGDHRQLPHLLEPEVEREVVGSSDVGQHVAEALKTSLFERLVHQMRAAEAKDGIRRVVTLNKQFRMHPVLGEFVSQAFYAPYGETFGSVREARDFAHGVPWLSGKVAAWIDVPASRGHESGRTSKVRPVEARRVAVEVKRIGEASPHLTIGVITFYTAQRDAILSELRAHGIAEDDGNGAIRIRDDWKATKKGDQLVERLRVGTVDAFQGLEFDVVLLSMTRSSRIQEDDDGSLRRRWGHLGLENRLCVALSRQRQALIVVGDSGMIQTARASEHVRGLHMFWNLCGSANGVVIRD